MTDLTIEQIPSPNHDAGRHGHAPVAIVNHVMQGTMGGTISEFTNPATKKSSNYAIGLNGRIVQFVADDNAAWANGNIREPNISVTPWVKEARALHINPNDLCISIEWEGRHQGGRSGWVPFNGAPLWVDLVKGSIPAGGFWAPSVTQYQAGLALIGALCDKHQIPRDRAHIGRHSDVDNVAKWFCPGRNFPLARLLADLNAPAPIPDDPYPIIHAPTIAPVVFNAQLVRRNSPALKEASGQTFYNIITSYGLDANIGLGFFGKESEFGTYEHAGANKADVPLDKVAMSGAKNWGNLRPNPDVNQPPGGRATHRVDSKAYGLFCGYDTWQDGLRDWCDKMLSDLYWGKTLLAVLEIYAPVKDGNDPVAYRKTLLEWAAAWAEANSAH